MEGWEGRFEQFMKDFDKQYEGDELAHRKKVFEANHKLIVAKNLENRSYTLGITAFADLTNEEFKSQYMGLERGEVGPIIGTHEYVEGEELASSIDWRSRGAVTPIKNQGQCGSCWAFSSTGAMEGAWFLATGKLLSFSEQQFVDCAKFRYGDMGCNGGLQMHAFTYAKSNAVCTEDSYPYTGKNSLFTPCKASSCTTGIPRGGVTGYKNVGHDAQSLMSALNQQPVSISIEADQEVFQHYKSGVLSADGCGSQLDHAVLAVGYGSDSQDYWIVKNSWGETWGEEGYIRIVRGKDECGLLNGPPLYPVVHAQADILV